MDETSAASSDPRRLQLIVLGAVAGLIILLLLTNLMITLLAAFPVFLLLSWLWYGKRLEAAKRDDGEGEREGADGEREGADGEREGADGERAQPEQGTAPS